MEQRDTLSTIHSATRIASLFLQDIVDDYFCNRDSILDEWEVMRICSEYERAAAKAEIARDLLAELDNTLKHLLKE